MTRQYADELFEDEFKSLPKVPVGGRRKRSEGKTHLTKNQKRRLWVWLKQRDEFRRSVSDSQAQNFFDSQKEGR